MSIDHYLSLYFYSAVFQANTALLALMAVLAVFKWQEMSNRINSKDNAILTFVQNYLDMIMPSAKHVPFNYSDIDTIKDVIQQIANDPSKAGSVKARAEALLSDNNFNARLDERKLLIIDRSTILNKMRKPFFWILGVSIGSLILLPFSQTIHFTSVTLEIIFICLTVITNIIAFVYLKIFAWEMFSKK